MPSISVLARSDQRPPARSTVSRRARSHTRSESINTPSRSKITPSMTGSRSMPGETIATVRSQVSQITRTGRFGFLNAHLASEDDGLELIDK